VQAEETLTFTPELFSIANNFAP